jgi:hypothetical protein
MKLIALTRGTARSAASGTQSQRNARAAQSPARAVVGNRAAIVIQHRPIFERSERRAKRGFDLSEARIAAESKTGKKRDPAL